MSAILSGVWALLPILCIEMELAEWVNALEFISEQKLSFDEPFVQELPFLADECEGFAFVEKSLTTFSGELE